MLYLKTANLEDLEKEWAFVAAEPADENGFINDYHGISFEEFKSLSTVTKTAVFFFDELTNVAASIFK